MDGSWEVLKEKFCLNFLPVSKVASLRAEIINFKQLKGESLGAVWARFKQILASGPNLSLPEPVVLQHFSLGLCPVATTFLDSASGGSFFYLVPSEARVVLDRILDNTPYTRIYDELPDEEEKQPEPEPKEPIPVQSKSISASSPSEPEAYFEPQPYSSPDHYDSLYTTLYDFDDDLFEDVGSATSFPRERCVEQKDQAPDKEELEYQREYLGRLSAIMSREWLDEAEASTEVVKMPRKTKRIFCEF